MTEKIPLLTAVPPRVVIALAAAGRSQTLVELVYDDGIRRLVEPYKIEYYVRKSDGVGLGILHRTFSDRFSALGWPWLLRFATSSALP